MKNDTIVQPSQYRVAHINGAYSLLAGAISGAADAFITHPITVNRLRVQAVPPLPITRDPMVIFRGVYSSMAILANLLAIRLTLRNKILHDGFGTSTPNSAQLLGSAFLSAALTSPLSSMIELGMVHQQKVKAAQKAPTVPAALFYIAKERGFLRTFLGAPCVAVRDGCFNAGFMGLTPLIKPSINEQLKIENDTVLTAVAGVLSGLAAAVVSHPFDTVKTAQHSNAFSKEGDSLFAWKTAKRIVREKGARGLYKGLFFRGARVTVGVALLSYATPTLSEVLPASVEKIRSNFSL